MRIEKCWFCSSSIYPGHGIVFVRNDARIFRFCRSKCHKHFKAKHNPKKFKWTKAYRKLNGKEMVIDKTFEFEQRRNTPIRYNRDLMIKTIKAIKRVDEIRTERKQRFYVSRILTNAATEKNANYKEKEIHKNVILELEEQKELEEEKKEEALKQSITTQIYQKIDHEEISNLKVLYEKQERSAERNELENDQEMINTDKNIEASLCVGTIKKRHGKKNKILQHML